MWTDLPDTFNPVELETSNKRSENSGHKTNVRQFEHIVELIWISALITNTKIPTCPN